MTDHKWDLTQHNALCVAQTSPTISKRSSKLCMDNSLALSMPIALATSRILALICFLAVNSISVCHGEPLDSCKENPKAIEKQTACLGLGQCNRLILLVSTHMRRSFCTQRCTSLWSVTPGRASNKRFKYFSALLSSWPTSQPKESNCLRSWRLKSIWSWCWQTWESRSAGVGLDQSSTKTDNCGKKADCREQQRTHFWVMDEFWNADGNLQQCLVGHLYPVPNRNETLSLSFFQ